jgi:hypothetical protein
MKLTVEEATNLVGIGFCQQKFYKTSVWYKAKKLMDTVVCPNSLARPFDFGRGKGKYDSELSINDVKARTVEIIRRQGDIVAS